MVYPAVIFSGCMKIRFAVLFCLLFTGQACFPAWLWSDPLPQGNGISSALRLANGVVVAVGSHGTIIRLAPGGSWTSSSALANGEDLTSLVQSTDRLFASGPSAGLWQSLDDGQTWTQADPNFSVRQLFWLGDRLVGLRGLSVRISAPGGAGETVDLRSRGITSYRSVAFGSGRIVIVGDGGLVARSSDGREWEITRPAGSDVVFYSVAAGESGFLLAGVKLTGNAASFEPVMLESVDGHVWTTTTPPTGAPFAYALLPSPGGWFFQNSGDGRLFRRIGSGPWLSLSGSLGPFAAAASVRSSNLRNTALLFDTRGLIAEVDEGSSAALVDLPLRPEGVLYIPRFAVAALDSLAVAVDRNTPSARENVVLQTLDGTNWNRVVPPAVSSLSALFASSGSIVGYSSGDVSTAAGFYRATLSTNGLSWSRIAEAIDPESGGDIFSGPVVSMAANASENVILALCRRQTYDLGGRFTATRSLYRSENWASWTPVALPDLQEKQPPFEEVAESVQWDGQQFILLVHPGRIFVSSDGKSWQQLPSLPDDSPARLREYGSSPTPPAGNIAVSVASDGSALVVRAAKLSAAGDSFLARSANGREIFYFYRNGRWWPQSVGTEALPSQRTIIWDGTQFVASGGRQILTSADGRSWLGQPAPASLSSLVWSGSKFFGFTDSFGILSHDGRLAPGQPMPPFGLEPGSRSLGGDGGSYELQLALPAGTAWKIEGKPSWLSLSPSQGTGPATVSVTAAANRSASARGAVLSIGGLVHYLHQSGKRPPPQLHASSLGAALVLPFAGQWQLAGDPRAIIMSRTSGGGAVRVRIAPNPSPDARTIALDVNGTIYNIVQEGTPVSLGREGSYDGLIGFVPEGVAPDPGSLQTFDGTARIQVTRPRGANAQGSYTARISLHDGQRTQVFAVSGTIDEQGRLLGGPWKSSGSAPRQLLFDDLRVVSAGGWSPRIVGSVKFADQPQAPYAVVAGKQVFDAKTRPLSSEYTGRFTAFLGSFAIADVSADLGVGRATITSRGTARVAATMADGSKVTASASVWGGFGPDLLIPYGVSFARGKSFAAGFFAADATNDQSDWQGLGAWNGRQDPFMNVHLCRYSSPPFSWLGEGAFSLQAGTEGFTGIARLNRSGNITVKPEPVEDLPLPQVSLRFDARSGLVTGSAQRRGAPPMRLLGAINPKAYALHGDRGAVSGLVLGSRRGSFGVVPVAEQTIVEP